MEGGTRYKYVPTALILSKYSFQRIPLRQMNCCWSYMQNELTSCDACTQIVAMLVWKIDDR